MIQSIISAKKRLIHAGHLKIRKRAISRCKRKYAVEQKAYSDRAPEDIEDIVAKEEREIVDTLKYKSLLAVVMFFVFGVI